MEDRRKHKHDELEYKELEQHHTNETNKIMEEIQAIDAKLVKLEEELSQCRDFDRIIPSSEERYLLRHEINMLMIHS